MAVIAAVMIALTATDTPWSLPDAVVLAVTFAGFVTWSVSRRAHTTPLALLVLAAVLVLKHDGQFDTALFLVSLVAAMSAAWSPTRVDLAVSLGAAVATPLIVTAIDPQDIDSGIWLMAILLPIILSRLFRRQSELVEQLARSQHELMLRDREQERRSVAREVHDVVAHGLAVMLVQITSARHVIGRDPDEADAALADAEAVGRESLAELRSTIELLRGPDAYGTSDPIRALQEIVSAARHRGLDAQVRLEGDLAEIGPAAGVTMVRVAQEALINASKHAPGSSTSVTVTVAEQLASLDVRSHDVPVAAAGRQPGFGLVGMRERVEQVGGSIAVGREAGDWLVRCSFPLGDPVAVVEEGTFGAG